MWASIWPILILAQAAPAPAAANEVDDRIICFSHSAYWWGSGAEVRAIEADPVPERFRDNERVPVCQPIGTEIAELIGWHLAFGSERSTAAALDYFEDKRLSGLPSDFPAALRRQSQTALAYLRRERTDPQTVETRDRLLRLPSMQVLDRLVFGLSNLVYLAEIELRAAEAFESLQLLERAQRNWQRASQAAPILTASAVAEPFARLLAVGGAEIDDFKMFRAFERFRLEDLRARIAILRAHLTRTPGDLARAEALVNAAEGPDYRRLAERAEASPDACAYDPDDSDRARTRTLCRAQEDFRSKVASWAVNRALLDQVVGGEDQRNDTLAFDLLGRGWLLNYGGCCRWSARDDMIRLHLMIADRRRRELDSESDENEMDDHWGSAAFALRNAADLVSPVDEPTRFRRIAEAWLELWDRAEASPADENGRRMTWRPTDQRYAVYLRRLLEDLPEIATAPRKSLHIRNNPAPSRETGEMRCHGTSRNPAAGGGFGRLVARHDAVDGGEPFRRPEGPRDQAEGRRRDEAGDARRGRRGPRAVEGAQLHSPDGAADALLRDRLDAGADRRRRRRQRPDRLGLCGAEGRPLADPGDCERGHLSLRRVHSGLPGAGGADGARVDRAHRVKAAASSTWVDQRNWPTGFTQQRR
jgi:hypothetical protein